MVPGAVVERRVHKGKACVICHGADDRVARAGAGAQVDVGGVDIARAACPDGAARGGAEHGAAELLVIDQRIGPEVVGKAHQRVKLILIELCVVREQIVVGHARIGSRVGGLAEVGKRLRFGEMVVELLILPNHLAVTDGRIAGDIVAGQIRQKALKRRYHVKHLVAGAALACHGDGIVGGVTDKHLSLAVFGGGGIACGSGLGIRLHLPQTGCRERTAACPDVVVAVADLGGRVHRVGGGAVGDDKLHGGARFVGDRLKAHRGVARCAVGAGVDEADAVRLRDMEQTGGGSV